MGQYADAIINGDVDEQTGEWLGDGQGFPRTREKGHYNSFRDNIDHNPSKFSKGTKAIRKELAILIKKTKEEFPERGENVIVEECRQAINTKYGKGWREQL